MNRILAACAGLLAGTCLAGAVQAAPYTPTDDQRIVERLPYRISADARRQQATVARQAQALPEALEVARAAIQRARQQGDPRELGFAQAALAPWWDSPRPPGPVRLLRATVRQSQHDFEAALADLQPLSTDPEAPLAVQAQATLTRAAVLQVMGRWAEAETQCRALQSPRFAALAQALAVPAGACVAELRSLQGDAEAARRDLSALARQAPDDRWLALLRAELATRLGDDRAAQALYEAAVQGDADVYARAAYADWLLDRQRHGEVIALLDRQPDGADADALVLRRAIALHRMGDARGKALATQLQARFDAARQRGGPFHAREEARLALDVLAQAPRALQLARENWSHQREPADAVLLWRAAQAAGQRSAADDLGRWVRDPARADVRLAGVNPGVAP